MSMPAEIAITCATDNASIYYTTDGTMPSQTNGTLYASPVALSEDKILRVVAVKDAYADSGITKMNYRSPMIPILANYGVSEDAITKKRFQELRDAGFTHSLWFYGSTTQVQSALDCAEPAGIKLLVLPLPLSAPSSFIGQFKSHPALDGYFIKDEPCVSDFATLTEWIEAIQAFDSDHWCYVNLFPLGASSSQLGASSYESYVDSFLNTVPVEILSFDKYPITTSGIASDYYHNLEIISSAAQAKGIPFWAYALSTAHWSYPIPTLTHLRFQIFSNLAYGAQGLQYFTYWLPPDSSEFHDSPIDGDGNRTDAWYVVQAMNKEIKDLSPVFLGASVVSVEHTGSSIPAGTTRYMASAPINSLTTSGSDGAVVSQLVNGSDNYLVVVNRDLDSTMTLTVSVDTTKNFSVVSKNGTKTALTSGTVSYTVDPADIVVLNWGASTLAVTPSSRSVTAEAGTTMFAISNSGGSTMSWSAAMISGSTWASIMNGSSGTNDGMISLSYAVNASTASRTATIRVTTTSGTTDVTIVQMAALTPGDANGDGMVDVGDLSILAANYGGSNKTWSQGDFNGDGLVDVGDLSILAANYGKGSSQSGADFDADYAKVFGTTTESTTSDDTDDENNDSSICSSMGLSLIAGLTLLGLMIVKLDE
jgi:hypothetical protein